jgi:hypothetical protein
MKEKGDNWIAILIKNRRFQRLVFGVGLICVAFTLMIWSMPHPQRSHHKSSNSKTRFGDKFPGSSQDTEKLDHVKKVRPIVNWSKRTQTHEVDDGPRMVWIQKVRLGS